MNDSFKTLLLSAKNRDSICLNMWKMLQNIYTSVNIVLQMAVELI